MTQPYPELLTPSQEETVKKRLEEIDEKITKPRIAEVVRALDAWHEKFDDKFEKAEERHREALAKMEEMSKVLKQIQLRDILKKLGILAGLDPNQLENFEDILEGNFHAHGGGSLKSIFQLSNDNEELLRSILLSDEPSLQIDSKEDLEKYSWDVSSTEYNSMSPSLQGIVGIFTVLLWSHRRGNLHLFVPLGQLMKDDAVIWNSLSEEYSVLTLDPKESLSNMHDRWITHLKTESNPVVEKKLCDLYKRIFHSEKNYNYPKLRELQQAIPENKIKIDAQRIKNTIRVFENCGRSIVTTARSDQVERKTDGKGVRSFSTMAGSQARRFKMGLNLLKKRI